MKIWMTLTYFLLFPHIQSPDTEAFVSKRHRVDNRPNKYISDGIKEHDNLREINPHDETNKHNKKV